MSIFNQNSRTENVIRIAMVSEVCTFVNLIFGFVYRSIFLSVLSAEYLGINGLFTQILQLLSLADLGIASAITYRFYKPIQMRDVQQVGKLMNYFKVVYRIILAIIMGLGLLILPFLHLLIKDSSEIPADTNLYVIYLLFLLQTASSYLFAYKQMLLTADQKQHVISAWQLCGMFIRYVAQTIILIVTRNYTLTISINIVLNIFTNYLLSSYVQQKYTEVFRVKDILTQEEKKAILKDTKACMCHKVGGVVLNSTDNVVLSKFVGLHSVGLYSNYSLIITQLVQLANQLLANTTASLGNAHVALDEEGRYRVYKNLIFVNLWFASTLTICLYVLINPFVTLWLGQDMVLGRFTVICLCAQFYFTLSRQTNLAFTSASGLFVKDMYRPFLESGINLVSSIILVKYFDVAGVFMGTVISSLTTVIWREPYLLFKFEFKRKPNEYIVNYTCFLGITILLCNILECLLSRHITNYLLWILCAVVVVCIVQMVLIIALRRREEFSYLKSLCFGIIKKTIKKC